MIYCDPAYSEKAVNNFAFKVSRRLFAAGDHSLKLEDIRQELWIAWCLAVESFDEKQGIPFLAYLRNGMKNHINRYVEKHVTRRHDEVIALSLESKGSDDTDSVPELHTTLPSADPLPDEDYAKRMSVRALCSKLSPTARQFVSLLYEEPEPLMKEVFAMKCKSDFASSMDLVFMNTGRLTKSMIFDLLGVERLKRKGVVDEVEKAIRKLSKAEIL